MSETATPTDDRHALLDRIACLERALADPDRLVLDYQQGKSVLCSIEHWAVKLIASSLLDTLGDAPNGMALDLTDTYTGQEIEVTVRRAPEGKRMTEVLADLRVENATLRAEVERLKAAPSAAAALVEQAADALEAQVGLADADGLRSLARLIRNGAFGERTHPVWKDGLCVDIYLADDDDTDTDNALESTHDHPQASSHLARRPPGRRHRTGAHPKAAPRSGLGAAPQRPGGPTAR